MSTPRHAVIHRMVTPDHVCPYGEKALELLRSQGYEVEDHWLRSRSETDAFKAEQGIETTPLISIQGRRIGGYEELRRHLCVGG